tara:strand:+ start:288 stop:515 length:228 start_codon:yes stop_codon:yes gene_type:complete
MNNQILITRIEESPSELGEPDCKLINPYQVLKDKTIEPLFIDYTNQKTFMIHSDKIFTITDPNSELIDKYDLINK